MHDHVSFTVKLTALQKPGAERVTTCTLQLIIPRPLEERLDGAPGWKEGDAYDIDIFPSGVWARGRISLTPAELWGTQIRFRFFVNGNMTDARVIGETDIYENLDVGTERFTAPPFYETHAAPVGYETPASPAFNWVEPSTRVWPPKYFCS